MAKLARTNPHRCRMQPAGGGPHQHRRGVQPQILARLWRRRHALTLVQQQRGMRPSLARRASKRRQRPPRTARDALGAPHLSPRCAPACPRCEESCGSRLRRRLLSLLGVPLLLASVLASSGLADVVLLRSASSPAGRQRVVGTIEEYTGRELVLVDAAGKRRRFKGQQVMHIEATWTPDHVAANEHLARGQYAQAVRSLQSAARSESRPWVRRLIVARLVEAYRELGQFLQACELYIELVEADPETPWFGVAPLAWLPGNPSPQLEERAQKWLQDDARSAAVLLAASHLLQTASHERAVARLETLAEAQDARYRALARAQLWRVALHKAGPEQLERWSLQAEEFPSCAVAGAAIVLSRAYAAQKHYQAAALWGLRAAVLYPDHASLAAEGLWQAGTALDKAGDGRLAARVLAELLVRFPEHRLTGPALERLRELDPELAASPEIVLCGGGQPGAAMDRPVGSQAPSPTALDVNATAGDAARFAPLAAALRARRLHALVAWYAAWLAERLHAGDLRQLELVCERSRSLIDQALETRPDARASLWQQAAAAVQEFVRSQPKHPRAVLAQIQAGLVELTRGEVEREELLAAGAAQATEEVRARLREAIRLLRAAEEQVQKLLRSPPPQSSETALSTRELMALSQHIAFQLARAYRNQALAYGPDSADRINALRQAQELLAPLAQLEPDHPLAWAARLDEIQCLRLLGDLEQALGRLALLQKAETPEAVRHAAQAEALRLALASDKLDQALSLAESVTQQGTRLVPDLALALLEVWLAAWQRSAAGQPMANTPPQQAGASRSAEAALAQELRNRAAALVQAMGQHGPYWSRRAEALLAGSAGNLAAAGDAELVRRAAAGLFRKGQVDQALEALSQARDAALAAGDAAAAFDAGFMAAAMLESSGRNAEAATQYRAAALAAPEHPRAAEAHLQAVYLSARSPAHADQPQQYQALLEEHLRLWPDATTAMQARVWLGRLHELGGLWREAVAAYERVPLDDRLGGEAIAGAARAYHSLLAQEAQQGMDVRGLAAAAGEHFARLVEPVNGTLPDQWSSAQREAALAAARLWLLYTRDHHRQAERLLSAAMNGPPPPAPQWQAAAQGWLVLALAAQGQRARAQELVGQLEQSAPEQLSALVLAIDPLLAAADAEVRGELASLQVALLQQLGTHSTELPEHEQAALALCRLRAVLAAEDARAALAEAQHIATAWPDAGKVQEACALLLTHSQRPELMQFAARRWQEIAARLAPGSARWVKANYYLALTWERLGQKRKAATLARYVQRLYPDAGDHEVRAQYAALLQRCQ